MLSTCEKVPVSSLETENPSLAKKSNIHISQLYYSLLPTKLITPQSKLHTQASNFAFSFPNPRHYAISGNPKRVKYSSCSKTSGLNPQEATGVFAFHAGVIPLVTLKCSGTDESRIADRSSSKHEVITEDNRVSSNLS